MNERAMIAKSRSTVCGIIRNFFDNLAYLETETPILSASLIPESAIEVFSTTLHYPHRAPDTRYLAPSPEIYMKRLLAEGFGNIYQLARCFRNAESNSPRHDCEFTMLEWYAVNKDYQDNIETQKNLLRALAPTASPETRHLFEHFDETSISELMLHHTDIDLTACEDFEAFKSHAAQKGFGEYAQRSETWEELFNRIFISHVENKLPENKTIFVKNYPAQIPTTAKRAGNFYERWELYMNGWEIANCYTEEARFEEMKRLFDTEEKHKSKMLTPHHVNYEYLEMFKHDFPLCSGVALGVDRLIAVYRNADSLDAIHLFPFNQRS